MSDPVRSLVFEPTVREAQGGSSRRNERASLITVTGNVGNAIKTSRRRGRGHQNGVTPAKRRRRRRRIAWQWRMRGRGVEARRAALGNLRDRYARKPVRRCHRRCCCVVPFFVAANLSAPFRNRLWPSEFVNPRQDFEGSTHRG